MSNRAALTLVVIVLLFCLVMDVAAAGAVFWLVKPGVMPFYADNSIPPDSVCAVGVSSYFRGLQGYRAYAGGRVEVYTLRFGHLLPQVGPLPLFDVCPHGRRAT